MADIPRDPMGRSRGGIGERREMKTLFTLLLLTAPIAVPACKVDAIRAAAR